MNKLIFILTILLFFSFCKNNNFAKNVIFHNSKCTNNKIVKIIEKDTTEYPCYKVDYEKLYVDSFTNEIIIKKYTNYKLKYNILKQADYIEFKNANYKILETAITKYINFNLTEFYSSAISNSIHFDYSSKSINPCKEYYSSIVNVKLQDIYADSNYLSICYLFDEYIFMAAHPYMEYKTYNFSKKTDSIITAKDYFICNQQFYNFLYKKFEKYGQNGWFEFKNIYDIDFNILENEIVFNCSNYEYTSYCGGSARIKIKINVSDNC